MVNKRFYIREILKKNLSEVSVVGWVSNLRDLGKIKFLILRDLTGIIQVTAVEEKTNKKIFEEIDKIPRESIVSIEGKIKKSEKAPGGKEIFPTKIKVLNKSEELPLDISENSKTLLSKRLDYRFLDLHRLKMQAIFKIQSEITHSRSEEHTSELQSHSFISYAVFCLKKKR